MVESMGAPNGNQNAKNAKRWQRALRRALARASNESVDKGLDLIADNVVKAAIAGEPWAITMVGDREDGKPATVIAGDDDHAPVRTVGRIELTALGS
jgi:ketosteroid isomerase-like protein